MRNVQWPLVGTYGRRIPLEVVNTVGIGLIWLRIGTLAEPL
jgi:hypothetical protein